MEIQDLLRTARDVAAHAYGPYSGVRVGAALEAEDGRVFTGCNVENASFGLTVCAERHAVAAAIAAGARSFTRVAIWSNVQRALAPCGACRQVLAEFAPSLEVVWGGDVGEPRRATLDELLGHALSAEDILQAREPGQ